jgi:hypothetical protein
VEQVLEFLNTEVEEVEEHVQPEVMEVLLLVVMEEMV